MATMSPASARSTGTRARPRKASSLVTRVFSMISPSRVQRLDLAVDGDGARFNAAGQDAAQEIVGFQRGHQHLEGMLVARQRLRLGRRHVFDDALEQRRQILALVFQLVHRPAVAARGIEMMEVELVVIGFQRQEQVEDGFQRFLGLGVVSGRSC